MDFETKVFDIFDWIEAMSILHIYFLLIFIYWKY